jgi:AcrR family transcriptional regulator
VPAPSRTSPDAVMAAGADLLEEVGLAGLTMQAVAARVGVRAPSLYKHVPGRDALVARIADSAVRTLGEALEAAAPEGATPEEALRGAAQALRSFAHARPAAFRLVFTPGPDATRASPESSTRAVAPVLRATRGLVGERQSLAAARTFTAWASGFLSMELADAFRMGGDVEEDFRFGVEALIRAFSHGGPGRGGWTA